MKTITMLEEIIKNYFTDGTILFWLLVLMGIIGVFLVILIIVIFMKKLRQ